MEFQFNAYIDESGDEGFKIKNGQWVSSEWFVIGALVTFKERDLDLARTVNAIKTDILKRNALTMLKPLHFVKYDHKQRRAIVNEICAHKKWFRFIAVGVDKTTTQQGASLRDEKQYLYNYATRLLIERISWLTHDHGKCKLIFENRTNTSYKDMEKYIDHILGDKDCQIKKHTISGYKVANKNEFKNLQIADCLVGSVFAALEKDNYGFTEDAYIKIINPCFYRRNKNLFSYGLKLIPDANKPNMQEKYPWLKEL